MRKILSVGAVVLLSAFMLVQFVSPAAAQDDRLDASPRDFTTNGDFDIVSYLSASAILQTAKPLVPGQEVDLTLEGFGEGDEVSVIIANPATLLGTFIVDADGKAVEKSAAARQAPTATVTVTIPANYREGYAEILASTSPDVTDRTKIVSVVGVYITKPGLDVITKSLTLTADGEQLIVLSTLAETGRESVVLVGFAALLVMGGVLFMDTARKLRKI